MTDDSVDVMGGSAVVGTEVKQENTGENQAQANSGQEKKTPETVPYERLSESVAEKNEFKKKYEDQLEINNNLSESVTDYVKNQNTQKIEEKPIESVEELMDVMRQEIDNRFKPIEEKRLTESYENNVKNFFSQDKDAAGIKDQMDQYYNNMPSYRKEAIVTAVSRGDISVLNEIKNTVALQHNQNLTQMATQDAKNEANKALMPEATRVRRDTAPGTTQLKEQGMKTGDFTDFFKNFAQQSGLV